ncbi:MAG: DUF5615 family PIN-like protein [Coleofasciculus sp. A1-SPW-01]|uniref:DUF5615 family PIN-like protein n=1 Tax=Coleofasciculus sp. A1-SPW-01 TaxID=3070819 RepID=UPI00330237BA
MGLRFFVDQCVPSSISQILHDADYKVLLLRDYIAIDSPDNVVIAKAQQLDAILVSLNGDFADIVSYPPANYRGIGRIAMRPYDGVKRINSRSHSPISKRDRLPSSSNNRFLRRC